MDVFIVTIEPTVYGHRAGVLLSSKAIVLQVLQISQYNQDHLRCLPNISKCDKNRSFDLAICN